MLTLFNRQDKRLSRRPQVLSHIKCQLRFIHRDSGFPRFVFFGFFFKPSRASLCFFAVALESVADVSVSFFIFPRRRIYLRPFINCRGEGAGEETDNEERQALNIQPQHGQLATPV